MAGHHKRLLPLTSDLVFHAVFGRDTKESRDALIALLNVILGRVEDPIVDITYLNPISYPADIGGKTPNMDIKVMTDGGELIDIEIQVVVKDIYRDRTVYYGSRMISDDLEKGQDYDKIKKTIVISILDEELFPETEKCHTEFRYIEREEGFELTDIISLHFLELSKIDTGKPAAEMTEAERLGAYIKYAAEDGKEAYIQELLAQGEGAIRMTDTILKKVSEEDILRERYQAEKKREYDINTMKSLLARRSAEAMEKGLEEGRKEGREAGRRESYRQLAVKLMAKGMTEEEIAGLFEITADQVRQLTEDQKELK